MTRKELGRGLSDLLAQNETDLPFLLGDEATQPQIDVMTLDVLTQLLSDLLESALVRTPKRLKVAEGLLSARPVKKGVKLKISGGEQRLPLVPSDLEQPGIESVVYRQDGMVCEFLLTSSSQSVKALFSRVVEHWFFTNSLSQ